MNEYKLEQACRADAGEILALYRRIVEGGRTTWNQYYPTMGEIEFDLQAEGLYVLREAGRVIAAASLVEHDDLDDAPLDWTQGRSCALERLCVAPEHQRQGLGEWMARAAMQRAGELGFEWMRLLVAVDNPTAERIYRRIGFRKTGEVEMYQHRYNAYECRISQVKE